MHFSPSPLGSLCVKRLPQGWQLMEQTLEPGASQKHLLKLSEFLGVMLFTLISNFLPLHVSFLASIALSSYPMTQIPLLRNALSYVIPTSILSSPPPISRTMTQRDGMGREDGGRFRMGSTRKSMADSCQCMAKTTMIV